MKYIIRSGKVKGEGRYMPPSLTAQNDVDQWLLSRHGAYAGATVEWTSNYVRNLNEDGIECRIVRLLSHEESKAKAKAAMLRELSYAYAYVSDDDLLKKADELWPAKGER